MSHWFSEDLDGDALEDVGIVVDRRLIVWFGRPAADGESRATSFAFASPQALDFSADVALYDVAEVAGDPARKEIVFFTPTRVAMIEARQGRLSTEPRTILDRRSAIDVPPDRKPIRLRFAQDFDGDGKVDLLVPEATGYALCTSSPAGRFAREQHLRVRIGAKLTMGSHDFLSRPRSVSGFPTFFSGNFDGDEKPDLVVFRSGRLLYFRQGEHGAFPESPTAELTVELPKNDSRRDGPERNPVSATDINGDGIQDLVVTETRSGTTRLYLGGAEFKGAATPAQVIKVKDWSIGTLFEDLNGDGRLDLIVPTTGEIGLFEALRILVTKEFTVTSYVFRNRGADLFPRQPDYSRSIRFPIQFSSDPTGGERSFTVKSRLILSYGGDFNGDAIRDLALSERPKTISIYYGNREASFSKEPDRVEAIPESASWLRVECDTADLNRDGFSDLLLLYRSADRKSDRLVVLLSRTS